MRVKSPIFAGLMLISMCLFFSPNDCRAGWGVAIESRAVAACPYDWELDLTVSWDIPLTALTIPIIVRSIDPGSFWALPLPVDTIGGNPVGVAWNWSNPGWAMVQEVRPAIPLAPCPTTNDLGYDGISPDHFIVHAESAASSTPAEPSGRNVLTLTIWNTYVTGDFEFDTACFSSLMHTIFMIDDEFPPVDHGPTGTGETVFSKGYITVLPSACPVDIGAYSQSLVTGRELELLTNTHNGHYIDSDPPRFYQVSGPGTVDAITGVWSWTPACGDAGNHHVTIEVTDICHIPGMCGMTIGFDVEVACGCCDCGETIGDLTCDNLLTPLDVSYLVWCVYKSQCAFCQPEGWCCTYQQGDVDCSGGLNPVDVAYYVSYVYKNLTPSPCTDPCGE